MAYNPISMDDEGSWNQNGVAADIITEGHSRPELSVAGVPIIDPMMTPSGFIRRCLQQYYFEFSWEVPFPRVPAAPLLYIPEEMNNLLNDSSPLGVMQAELDAMSEGVLDRIPLSYYLLRPEVVEETRNISMELERREEEMRRQATLAGLPVTQTWRPEEVNPYLEKADAELLDTDIDLNLVLERDKPSLTLLQRPLYTDIGLVSQEQRHMERLARIVPESLRGQPLLTSSPESQGLHGLSFTSLGEVNMSVYDGEGGGGGLSQVSYSNGNATPETAKEWFSGVQKSFRCARGIDAQYEAMLETVARRKLGLDSKKPATMRFTRRLWQLLFEDTNKKQQRSMWHQLCRFSSNYDDRGEAAEQLERAMISLQLPHPQLWSTLVREYMDLLRDYIAALPGGNERRKDQLQISGRELDPHEQGAFEPDIQLGAALRRVGKDFGVDRQPLPVFPVEVMPLFPAGFGRAAEEMSAGGRGCMENLGELEKPLHHIVLQGAVVDEESKTGGPHALVNNTNLLVADKKSAREVSSGLTVSYHTSRENTFEPLVFEENNTSSYLFQLCGAQESLEPTASPNADRRHAVYSRLRIRNLFAKALNTEILPYERYVLMFDSDGEVHKRPREEVYGDAEEPLHPMQRVE